MIRLRRTVFEGYKLAEANGMTGRETLTKGQEVRLPAGVVRSKFNAGTFKPYDQSAATGDLSAVPPGKDAGCGAVGQILMVAVAVAVTVVTAGQAGPAMAAVISSQ